MTDGAAHRFPWVDTPGGWDLGPQFEVDASPTKHTARPAKMRVAKEFLSAKQFGARVGMTRAFYQLRARDGGIWVCDPDVLAGDIAGWSEARCVEWGIQNELLNDDGTIPEERLPLDSPTRARARRKFWREPLPEWRFVTLVYLNVLDVSRGLGVGRSMVRSQRNRGLGVEPAVLIGEYETINIGPPGAEHLEVEKRGALEGFALEHVEEWAPQFGRNWQRPDYIAAALERLEKQKAEREGRLL